MLEGKNIKFHRLLSILAVLLLFSCAKPSLITKREAVINEAIELYLGTPYKFGGSSYEGIDCSGLVMNVYRRAGIEVPRSTREQIKGGERINFRELRFGDVVFFKRSYHRKIGESLHVGIYLGDNRFVHASKSKGVIVDSLNKNYWKRLFLEARRFY